MLKEEYFKQALKSGAYKYRNWLISIFTEITGNDYKEDFPYKLIPEKGKLYFINENGLKEEITDYPGKGSLIKAHDELILQPGDAVNIKQKFISTYGRLFYNYYMLIYPFGDKLDFINKQISVKNIEALIVNRFEDDPEDITQAKKDVFYPFERSKLQEANYELSELNGYLIASITKKSMFGSPNNKKIKDQLLKNHKGDPNDPVLGAMIDEALIKEEKEHIKTDEDGSQFFYDASGKSYADRKRLYGSFGYEAPFTNEQEGKLITSSLDEGIEREDFVALVNGARSGSDARANDTQIGGARSKDAFRSFQNDIIEGKDCGTTMGIQVIINKDQYEFYMGQYFIDASGKPVEIDSKSFTDLIGKTVVVRLPSRCISPPGITCETCAGRSLSKNKRSPAIATGNVGKAFLIGSLKKIHVATAKLTTYNFDELVS